jgi:hypothetical protein
MTRAGSVLFAALILISTVAVGFGPGLATAQTDTYAQEFTTGPHKVKVDLSNVTTETTIAVITSESPAGDNATIMRKTVSGTTPSAHFRNAGAYQEFTIQVEGADAKPGFSKGGPTAAWTPGESGKFLGDTGGDADFTYDMSERIGESVMPQIVQLDRTGLPDSTTVDTDGTDASQTKLDLYYAAQNQQSSAQNHRTTLDNYLSDTKTQARIIGKNAYIKALNQGDSKSAAKSKAKTAVDDYYAVKQVQLLNTWEAVANSHMYYVEVSQNESGIANDYAELDVTGDYPEDANPPDGTTQRTVTLTNGTTTEVTTIDVSTGGYSAEDANRAQWLGPTHGPIEYNNNGYSDTIRGLKMQGPTSDHSPLTYGTVTEYKTHWDEIESQSTSVQNDMDTLAENTYSAYQSGEINNSDLVDPYVLANQQSAGEDFQGWTAAQLTLLGTTSPENFDQIGSFNVTTGDGTQYEGVLFSQENPASGQFENGTTYNTSNIGGTQYVVTSDRIVELDGEFTIDSISTQDGQTVQNVTIQKTTYETTNVTDGDPTQLTSGGAWNDPVIRTDTVRVYYAPDAENRTELAAWND